MVGGKQRVDRELGFTCSAGRLRQSDWSYSIKLELDRNSSQRLYGIGNDALFDNKIDFTGEIASLDFYQVSISIRTGNRLGKRGHGGWMWDRLVTLETVVGVRPSAVLAGLEMTIRYMPVGGRTLFGAMSRLDGNRSITAEYQNLRACGEDRSINRNRFAFDAEGSARVFL